MSKKEACPKCSHDKFAKATDGSNRHYCAKCSHVWLPGAQGNIEALLKRAHAEVQELKIEVSRLRAKLHEAVVRKSDIEGVAQDGDLFD